MKNLIVILTMILITAGHAAGQNYKAISAAFDSSYAYEEEGKYEKAMIVLQAVYADDSYETNLRLGYLAYLSGMHTQSLTYYAKAIALKPYAIEPRLGYVMPASEMGNWDQVLEQYQKILAVDPMNTTVNYRIGYIFYVREQYETALKHFEKVANLYPFDYDTIIMYAWTNYRLGKLREAKVLFEKALIIRPGDASATEGLGLVD